MRVTVTSTMEGQRRLFRGDFRFWGCDGFLQKRLKDFSHYIFCTTVAELVKAMDLSSIRHYVCAGSSPVGSIQPIY